MARRPLTGQCRRDTRARCLAAWPPSPWCRAGDVAALAPAAHPLGNSSVNHLTYVKVFADRVSLLYVLDQAEYPTLRDLRAATPAQLFASKVAEVRRRA